MRSAVPNPLVEFIRDSKRTLQDVWPPEAPLLGVRAEEKLRKEYQNVALPILVYYGPSNWEKVTQLEQYANQVRAIVLYVREDPEKASDRGYHFYARAEQQRGQATRITPMTPFVLLHRLGDVLQNNIDYRQSPAGDLEKKAIKLYYDGVELVTLADMRRESELRERLKVELQQAPHAGINTKAGRMGVITDWTQGLSELFAKYLLTGVIAYAPPVSDVDLIAAYHEDVKQLLVPALIKMEQQITLGKVYFI
jgi:hypothetical protein